MRNALVGSGAAMLPVKVGLDDAAGVKSASNRQD